MKAVALFVDYPLVPEAIRKHGRQPSFQFGHCLLIRPLGSYAPGWLDEFLLELGPVTDCVPVCGVRGINFQTHGAKAPTTPAEREALQNAMGTQDKGADEKQLAAGILKRYGIAVPFGQDWAAIVKAIGSETTQVIVGDPLAASDYASVALGALKPASAGLGYRYVTFTEQPTLPDTAAGDDPVWYSQIKPYPASHVKVPAGKWLFNNPTTNAADRRAQGPFDFDCTGQVAGVTYYGNAQYLVYATNEGGFACIPAASLPAGSITPLGGYTKAQLDAAVKAARHQVATEAVSAASGLVVKYP